MRARTISTLVFLLVAPGMASAADGRLEINQACVAAGCFAGDAPGLPVQTQPHQSYVLTSNLALGPSLAGVVLEDGSTLDFNGFEIAGDLVCSGTPAICPEQDFSGAAAVVARSGSVLRGGTIRGTRGLGVLVEPFVRVERMRIEQNGAGGLGTGAAGAGGCLVEDSFVLRNGHNAMSFAVVGGTLGARIVRNTIHGNGAAGVVGAVSLLEGNAITKNAEAGAELNYLGSTTGYAGNQFFGNNLGSPGPQLIGGVEIGPNVCGTDTVCP